MSATMKVSTACGREQCACSCETAVVRTWRDVAAGVGVCTDLNCWALKIRGEVGAMRYLSEYSMRKVAEKGRIVNVLPEGADWRPR